MLSRSIGGTKGTVISVCKFLFRILFEPHTLLLYVHRSVVLKIFFTYFFLIFFSIYLDVTWLIFHLILLKRAYKFFKMFSMIRIGKQSLNHKFWGFILILSVPWGHLRSKCPCHNTTFFPSVWHVFHLLLWQHWCCFGWPLWVRWLHSDNINALSIF